MNNCKKYAQLMQSVHNSPLKQIHVANVDYKQSNSTNYYKVLRQCSTSIITCLRASRKSELIVVVDNLEFDAEILPNDEKELHGTYMHYGKQIHSTLDYLHNNYIPKEKNENIEITLCSHGLGATMSYWAFMYVQGINQWVDRLVLYNPITRALRNYRRPKHALGPKKRSKIIIFKHNDDVLSANVQAYMISGELNTVYDTQRMGAATAAHPYQKFVSFKNYHELFNFT